ncbi:helicase [Serendipita sp. 398]|nr:helicase [Serendipita sp. 398]
MKSNNLPFSVTLKDLAVLRASDVDLSTVLEAQEPSSNTESLERSREFIKEARAALKIANSESVEKQGARIEEVPSTSSASLKLGASSGLQKGYRRPFKALQPSSNGKITGQQNLSAKPPTSDRQYPPSKTHVHVTDLFEDEVEPVGGKYEMLKGPKVDESIETLWSVNWRKSSTKKNKTWDGDGVVHQKGSLVRFMSDNTKKLIGTKTWDVVLALGSKLWIGDKEIEVDAKLPLSRLNSIVNTDIIDLEDSENIPPPPPTVPIARKFTAPAVVKKVERQEDVIRKPKPLQALHDPTTPGAIVMKSPSTTHQQRFNPKWAF